MSQPSDWKTELENLRPELLRPYADDPVAMRSIETWIRLLPDSTSQVLAMEILQGAGIRLDEPIANVLIGAQALSARLLASEFHGAFASVQAISDRASELRRSIAQLNTEVTGLGGVVTERSGQIASELTALPERIKGEFDKDSAQRLRVMEASIVTTLEQMQRAIDELANAADDARVQVGKITASFGQQVDQSTTAIAETTRKELGETLQGALKDLIAAIRAHAVQAADDAVDEHIIDINKRMERLSKQIETMDKTLTTQIGPLDTRMVKLHPLLEHYLAIAAIPRTVIWAGVVGTAIALVVGLLAGAWYGAHAHVG